MGTGILDYIRWRGDLSLHQSPFNAIDALILCELSYLKLHDIVPAAFSKNGITVADAAHDFFYAPDLTERSDTGLLINTALVEMLRDMANSERFANVRLCGYAESTDPAHEKQFAALTALPGDGSVFIAYRGTDDTIIGWKEDFNMAFMAPVPSQLEALAYVRQAAKLPGKLRIGGHSKGGNLAVYAATFCPPKIKRRIVSVYNNDGPGFEKDITGTPEFAGIRDKIATFVPQTSIIGMLLEHQEEYTVIESEENGIMQHDPFSWQIVGAAFKKLDTLTDKSLAIDKTIRDWLSKMDCRQREQFVDALFTVLTSSDAATLSELSEKWSKNPAAAIKALLELDENTRRIVWDTLQQLFKSAKENIPLLADLFGTKHKKTLPESGTHSKSRTKKV
ncbi:DUF2974 domain-containing protein [Treponema brennaborense]|uniref:DUF2974 domain-containing protein n=1 Tax=Treponema brennaborense (strain DSM 12168 / CIP 105900 / DD5/3) TaxID=906968 RepID=F4LMD7_TREBD|nr:DUF2974 domain-containing protein [Treponema brennaborense]AEE15699.1 hypothetical protein Trebr_0250 [Treponema brennaborense DSM 12168]